MWAAESKIAANFRAQAGEMKLREVNDPFLAAGAKDADRAHACATRGRFRAPAHEVLLIELERAI
jgi:hypothetical protein